MSFVNRKFVTYDIIIKNIQNRKVVIMKYYQRIRDIREDNDKKQSDIAEFLKIDTSYYGKYERGVHPIPVEHIIQLCYYYNISADYLLGLTDEPKKLK